MNCAIQAGVGTNHQTRTTTALGYSETLYVITISSAPKLIHRRTKCPGSGARRCPSKRDSIMAAGIQRAPDISLIAPALVAKY
jgi:hypothetical protein